MKIVITGIRGAINSGDYAQFLSLLDLLKELYPCADVYGLTKKPEFQKDYIPHIKWKRQIGGYSSFPIVRKLQTLFYLIVALIKTRISIIPISSEAYSLLSSADLVVACPGGWMEDVSGVSILTNLTHLEIARRYNRPLIFAPQSFGPFKNTISRKWASSIVNYASLVFVREPLSYDYVKKEFGVSDEKTFLVSDMAFYYYGSNCKGARMLTEKLKLDDVFFGTTVLDYGFSESQSPTETRRKYFENIIEVAKRIYAELEIKTVFFRLTHTTRDKNTLLSILDKIGNTGVVILDMLELDTLRSMIARCSVFYGTRFHSNIFAISSGVPVVAVAYQPKAFGIMKMCKQDDYIVDIYNFTADELFNKIRRAYENRDGIRQELDAFHASVQSDRNLLKEKLMSITK